ncbi:3-deoxy-manno-octulosonate cytidylyltransferase [Bacillus sp. P14.5]|uniref:3-deoxy-manno-octulosonate cytidylyltransferase n=1 Tax=Bacillus sp. P14.5 TaxID=1983400 RepID=UPI000DEBC1F9|nr:3-deoxy-manno-octulosonate cytidylyltransferase [Bacillus sp. P14.5]
MKVVGVIPARYGSTRFPGKPLAIIKGKPMIQQVFEQVKRSKKIDEVVIATDHLEIVREAEKFCARVVMTSREHESGSDRIAEVTGIVEGDIFINIQGDEPLIHPSLIDEIIQLAEENPDHVITACTKLESTEEIDDPNVVKVVTSQKNEALYFSRSPIPYQRNTTDISYYKHLGIYCYPKHILKEYVNLPQSPLEQAESLEQLRLIENGYKLKVLQTHYDAVGVDTPEDIAKVELIMEGKYND